MRLVPLYRRTPNGLAQATALCCPHPLLFRSSATPGVAGRDSPVPVRSPRRMQNCQRRRAANTRCHSGDLQASWGNEVLLTLAIPRFGGAVIAAYLPKWGPGSYGRARRDRARARLVGFDLDFRPACQISGVRTLSGWPTNRHRPVRRVLRRLDQIPTSSDSAHYPNHV
jgi:hypothetical protein